MLDAANWPLDVRRSAGEPRVRTLQLVTLTSRIGVALGAFALVSALAELLGATNLGTAFGFGQIAFALTAAFLLIRA